MIRVGVIDTEVELNAYTRYAHMWREVKTGQEKDTEKLYHTMMEFYDAIEVEDIKQRFKKHYTWEICIRHDPPGHKNSINEAYVSIETYQYKMKLFLLYADGLVHSVYQSRALWDTAMKIVEMETYYHLTRDTAFILPSDEQVYIDEPIIALDNAMSLETRYNEAVRNGDIKAAGPEALQICHYFEDTDDDAGLND